MQQNLQPQFCETCFYPFPKIPCLNCQRLRKQQKALGFQRIMCYLKNWESNKNYRREKALTRWRIKNGEYFSWIWGQKALRKLELNNPQAAIEDAQRASDYDHPSYLSSLVRTWLLTATDKHEAILHQLEITLSQFQKQAWQSKPSEKLRLFLLLTASWNWSGKTDKEILRMLSAGVSSCLFDPDFPENVDERLKYLLIISPLKIQHELIEAFSEIQQRPFYEAQDYQALGRVLREVFYGAERDSFLRAERKYRQRYWWLGFPVLPFFAWTPFKWGIFVWLFIWIGFLFKLEWDLQTDLKSADAHWLSVMDKPFISEGFFQS